MIDDEELKERLLAPFAGYIPIGAIEAVRHRARMLRLRRHLMTAALVVVVAGATIAPLAVLLQLGHGGRGTGDRFLSPRPLPRSTASERHPSPLPGGRLFRFWPRSARVEPGVPYHVNLACGLDGFLDFDGSFWDLIGPPNLAEKSFYDVRHPGDSGIAILTSSGIVEYKSSKGKTFRFMRHPGPKDGLPCY